MYQHLPSKPFLFTSLFSRGPVYLIFQSGGNESMVRLYPNDPSRTTDIHVDAEQLLASVCIDGSMRPCIVPWREVVALLAPEDHVELRWQPAANEGAEEDDQGDFVDSEFHSPVSVRLKVIDGDSSPATESALPRLQLVT